MRKAKVFFDSREAGYFEEREKGKKYRFTYLDDYQGAPISLTMPIATRNYEYDTFPPFFDGLLPEGVQLEGLLKSRKIDKNDLFQQLIAVGGDCVGTITIEELPSE